MLKTCYFMPIIPLLFVFVRAISPFTTMYTSVKSHKSDLSIDVLNLIYLLGLYLSSALPDWSWTSTYFLVINLGTSSIFVPNKFVIFWYSIFIWCLKQSQVINNLLSFFWWYVDFLFFFFFFFTLCFT